MVNRCDVGIVLVRVSSGRLLKVTVGSAKLGCSYSRCVGEYAAERSV